MRKREIHSVAHWAMMFILLMFPILMVVVGAFQNAEYQPDIVYNDVQTSNLISGNKYRLITNLDTYTFDPVISISSNYLYNYATQTEYTDFDTIHFNGTSSNYLALYKNGNYVYAWQLNDSTLYTFEFTYYGGSHVDDLPYTVQSIEHVDNYHYKNDVNLWTKSFLDLPINAWYKSLMNVIGVGFTSSTVMNVIYVMPVYILWVFIFDVIVDCFLVIIKLPHKLLNRLSGGENE